MDCSVVMCCGVQDRRRRTRRPAPSWPTDEDDSGSGTDSPEPKPSSNYPVTGHQQATAPTNPLSYIPLQRSTQHDAQHSMQSPRDREPAAADRATLATPGGQRAASHSMHAGGGSAQQPGHASLATAATAVGSSRTGVRGILARKGSAQGSSSGLTTAERPAPAVIDVMSAHVGASIDVATGGPVAVAAACDLEATMWFTSTTAPLVEQSITKPPTASKSSVDPSAPVDTSAADAEAESRDTTAEKPAAAHSASLKRSASQAALLAAGGARSEGQSSAAQLAQCMHEVSVDDNFRFAPGRLVEALQPLSPTQVCRALSSSAASAQVACVPERCCVCERF